MDASGRRGDDAHARSSLPHAPTQRPWPAQRDMHASLRRAALVHPFHGTRRTLTLPVRVADSQEEHPLPWLLIAQRALSKHQAQCPSNGVVRIDRVTGAATWSGRTAHGSPAIRFLSAASLAAPLLSRVVVPIACGSSSVGVISSTSFRAYRHGLSCIVVGRELSVNLSN